MTALSLGLPARTTRRGVAALAVAGLVQGTGSLVLGPLADASSRMVEATTNVNVRQKPSTAAKKLGLLKRGQQVELVSSSDGWAKVKWQGQTAYIASAYLTASKTASPEVTLPAAQGVVHATANLNLRRGPSTKDAVVRVAPKGTRLELAGRVSGAYALVIHNGQQLWAATAYLSDTAAAPSLPAAKGQLRATAALMIRTTADSSFRSLGDVPRGTILEATGVVTNGMAQVIWKGNLRWVNAKYTESVSAGAPAPAAPAVPDTQVQFATANLNIWNAATGSAYSGEIPRGAQVAITGKVQSGRAQIVHNGAVKWVTAKYLSANPPQASAGAGGGTPNTDTSGRSGINKGWSTGLEKTNKWAQAIAWHVWDNYPQIKTQYGWRRDVTPDHPAGRAVDVMIPYYKTNRALGREIAEYFRAHARDFNINYIIFEQKIWSVQRNSEGWRKMASRGNDTANHYDHVHVNTYGPEYGF